MTDGLSKIQRIIRVSQAFTPGAPVARLSLFAGRRTQMMDVISAVAQRGRHVALYGERGVGKTSLANIIAEVYATEELPEYQSATINCGTDDTFDAIWQNVFRELGIDSDGTTSPEDVRFRIAKLDPPALIVIDELDRFDDDQALSLLADTIKTLSDHSVASTLLLVGVAGSIDDLIGEHESVERALIQVEMPKMDQAELQEILDKGCAYAGLTVTEAAARKITTLSQGFPHFTHLLGLHSGERVIQDDRTEITIADVSAAIDQAVARHSIRSDYQKAVRSPRADNLYPHVLLACALAKKDALGYFTAGAVREPLSGILGKRMEIPAFARHLRQFIDINRGAPLHREGIERRYFYRFANPLLQPYAILNGWSQGLITEDLLSELERGAISDEPNEPQPLF